MLPVDCQVHVKKNILQNKFFIEENVHNNHRIITFLIYFYKLRNNEVINKVPIMYFIQAE